MPTMVKKYGTIATFFSLLLTILERYCSFINVSTRITDESEFYFSF